MQLELNIPSLGVIVKLTEKCWECNNTEDTWNYWTKDNSKPKKSECTVCKGVGYLPTENGIAILELVKNFNLGE